MEPVTIDPITEVTNTQLTMNWVALEGVYKGGTSVDVDSYEI